MARTPLLAVPRAAVLHPWWAGGARVYGHFLGWSLSDGELQDLYPALTYRAAPDAVELAHLCTAAGAGFCGWCWKRC